MLECVALHAKRRQLEESLWPPGEAYSTTYQRVAKDRWDGGLYAYLIVPFDPSSYDPARDYLESLRKDANEEYLRQVGESLWREHHEEQAAR